MSPLDVILWALAVLIAFSVLVIVVYSLSTGISAGREEARRIRRDRDG